MTETRFRRRAAMRLGGPASPIMIRPRANPRAGGVFPCRRVVVAGDRRPQFPQRFNALRAVVPLAGRWRAPLRPFVENRLVVRGIAGRVIHHFRG